jgi:adenylate kinase
MLPPVNVLVSLVLPMMTADPEYDWRVREDRDREARKEDRRKSERHQIISRCCSGRRSVECDAVLCVVPLNRDFVVDGHRAREN